MGCCGKGEQDDDVVSVEEKAEEKPLHKKEPIKHKVEEVKKVKENEYAPFDWYPTINNIQQIAYVRGLEKQYQYLQTCYLNLSTQMARLQFRVRQIIQADPSDRARLINDLKRVILAEDVLTQKCDAEELPSLEQHNREMGDIRKKQHMLINTLRRQIGSLQEASNHLTIDYNYDDSGENREYDINLNLIESHLSQLKESESHLRKTGGTDYFMNSFTRSSETCSSYDRNETSVRSTSFKELQEMFDSGCSKKD